LASWVTSESCIASRSYEAKGIRIDKSPKPEAFLSATSDTDVTGTAEIIPKIRQKEQSMYIMIRRYKTDSPTEVTRFANEGFLPLVADADGLVAYYGIESGEDSWASVSVFETAAGAEESNRITAKFIKGNPDLARLLKARPQVVAGSVAAYLERP
jgi:hypothetical protein